MSSNLQIHGGKVSVMHGWYGLSALGFMIDFSGKVRLPSVVVWIPIKSHDFSIAEFLQFFPKVSDSFNKQMEGKSNKKLIIFWAKTFQGFKVIVWFHLQKKKEVTFLVFLDLLRACCWLRTIESTSCQRQLRSYAMPTNAFWPKLQLFFVRKVKRGDYQFSKLPSFWGSTNSHRSVGFVVMTTSRLMMLCLPTRGYDTSGDGVISIKAPDVLVWRNPPCVSVVQVSSFNFSVWLRMIHFQAFQFSTLVFFWKVPGSSATMLMYFLIEIHHFFLLNHDSSKNSETEWNLFRFYPHAWNCPSDQGAVSNVPWQCIYALDYPWSRGQCLVSSCYP